MKALLAFLLIPLGIGGYFYGALEMGIYERYPVPALLLGTLGIYFLGKLVWAAFSVFRMLLTVAALALMGGFGWFTLIGSVYPTTETRLHAGDALAPPATEPALVLKTSKGEPFVLDQELRRSPATVVIFFRGFW